MSRLIAENWEEILERVEQRCVKVGRPSGSVRVVAVSKIFPAEAVVEGYAAGARIFGESYIQEALPKIDQVEQSGKAPDIEWHFIGGLQSNKAKQVVGHFSLIHSLDRWSLAQALEKQRRKIGGEVNALLEVNLAEESSKSGIAAEKLYELAERISQETEIHVLGLMTFPPWVEDAEESRHYFAKARLLAEELARLKLPRIKMQELSMGVTSDFEVAVEEGATLVRIGTAIFGKRCRQNSTSKG